MVKGGARGPDSLDVCEETDKEVVLSVMERKPTDVSETFQDMPELERATSDCESSEDGSLSAFSCSEDDFDGEDVCWDHFDVLDCCLRDD